MDEFVKINPLGIGLQVVCFRLGGVKGRRVLCQIRDVLLVWRPRKFGRDLVHCRHSIALIGKPFTRCKIKGQRPNENLP